MIATGKRQTVVIPASIAAMTLAQRIHAGELINFLIVRVGTERFAIELGGVQEAVDADMLEQLPQTPAETVGVLRWRGAAHLVWSPAGVLRAKLERADTALFLRGDGAPVALAVDDVEDLVTIPGSAVRALQGVDDGDGLVVGAVRVGESLATVLDPALLASALSRRAAEAS